MKTLDKILEIIYDKYREDTGVVNAKLLDFLEEAKQEILDWVDKEIIGENNMEKGDALSRFQIESVNVFREEQRQKLQKLKEI